MKYEVTVREFEYSVGGVSMTKNKPVEHEAERVSIHDGGLRGFDKDNEMLWAYPPGEWFGIVQKP